MLSILIPCYNYPSYNLVRILYDQCMDLGIDFEILVSEDAGDKYILDNKNINKFQYCQYVVNDKNLGRAGNINRLLKWSKYDLKLVLDCDLTPKTQNFISDYLHLAEKHQSFVCFGGIDYIENQDYNNNLRYNYGLSREAKKAKIRQNNPYKYLLTSNLFTKNCNQLFDERVKTYGYEDLVFAHDLKTKKIKVLHIDNPLYHNNLEENEIYLKKVEQALKTLIHLEKQSILSCGLTGISKLYHTIHKCRLSFILSLLYPIFQNSIFKRLKNNGRPIWLLDFYKLLYFNKNY